MKMLPGYKTRFPKFYDYVQNEIPKLKAADPIIRAIERYAGYPGSGTVKHAMKWGFGPSVKVVPNLTCGVDKHNQPVRAVGCYRHNGVLEIKESLVRAFERGTDKRQTASGRMVHVAGVTLLHELTHWADWMDETIDELPQNIQNNDDIGDEKGNAFEIEVYGRVIGL